jgi:hypothetical protein
MASFEKESGFKLKGDIYGREFNHHVMSINLDFGNHRSGEHVTLLI